MSGPSGKMGFIGKHPKKAFFPVAIANSIGHKEFESFPYDAEKKILVAIFPVII